MDNEKAIAVNRQARFYYRILDSLEVGIELKGTEIKSIREGKISIKESFARVERDLIRDQVFLYNCHISPYKYGNRANVEPKRRRRLLLHRNEIQRLIGQTSPKGMTLIPLKVYFKRGFAKMELALCKRKQQHDKRETIRRRETERHIQRKIRGK